MQKYITLHAAERFVVTESGGSVYRVPNDITAYVDLWRDLHICRELLTSLSYEEIEGIIALAIAEKVCNKPLKLTMTGVTTCGTTLGLTYWLNRQYKWGLGDFFKEMSKLHDCERKNISNFIALTIIAPIWCVGKTVANNLQKTIDLKAAELTNHQNIIAGIKGRMKVERAYFKENCLSRIASALCLNSIYNAIFYPIRSYTDEEWIEYLQNEARLSKPTAVVKRVIL